MQNYENRYWKYVMILLYAFLLVIMTACSSGDEAEKAGNGSDGADGQQIHVRMTDDPDFLDPHKVEASITEQMILNMFEGLLAPKPDGTLEGAVAEDYDVSDDRLTYTFHLRQGVTFHDGEPVTTDDIIYSFDRLTGKNSEQALSSDFDDIEEIEAPDDDTVVITLTEPDASFLNYLTAIDSAIIPESNDGRHNDHPIGTGPFQFVEYAPGSEVVMEKNTDYWDEGIPHLDEVTFSIQADDQSALLSMQSGELDLMDVPPHRIPEIEDDFNVVTEQANSTFLLGFNQDVEPFDDRRVRQAINYAVNKDDIIEATFSGYAEKIGSNMSPAMDAYYREGLEDHYGTDVDKARELLADAGYPDGFETTITISSHNEWYTDMAQVVAENLKEVGIDAEIEVIEWGVWLERVYDGREYDMTVIDFTGKLDPYDILKRYVSTEDKNFLNFDNDEYDIIMENVLQEEEEEDRITMYKRAQEILTEEAAAVYVADYQFVWILHPELEGYKQYPIFFHDMSEVTFSDG